MKKILDFLTGSDSLYVLCLVLFAVAFINSFFYIGLIEDGVHHFWEALTRDNVFIGHDGINAFPYNTRYFSSLFPHLVTGITALLGLSLNIKHLLFLFTFLTYVTPILFLIIIYLNIPKEKKNNFEIIVLSFLICILFMAYQIWTENFITGLFLWTVFSIYFYADFKNLSKLNKVSLIIFPFILISSHPVTAIIGPVLLVYGFSKYYHIKQQIKSKNIILISFIILLTAILFNTYYILNPVVDGKDAYYKLEILRNFDFFIFSICILTILLISSQKLDKYLTVLLTLIFMAVIVYHTLFNIETYLNFNYRVLGFIIPLFFIIAIIIFRLLNIQIRYKVIRLLNYVLMSVFLLNTYHYGNNWKTHLKSFEQYLEYNKEIVLVEKNGFCPNSTSVKCYKLYHNHSMPFITILLPKLFSNENLNYVITVKTGEKFFNIFQPQIIGGKHKLLNYNINIDKCFSLINEDTKSI
ncbi:MAG: hypothetical protein PHR82_07460 [Endomicrobiaceae bacterium]|nr:hypothetical protein [Endomicrobiaceae bacterium]